MQLILNENSCRPVISASAMIFFPVLLQLRFTTFATSVSFQNQNIGLVWGRNSAVLIQDDPTRREPSLRFFCSQKHLNNIFIPAIASFCTDEGQLNLSLPHHCFGSTSKNSRRLDCRNVGKDIKYCQKLGKQVWLTVENLSQSSMMENDSDGERVANGILDTFFSEGDGPLGDVTFDGINFSLRDTCNGYSKLISVLHRKLTSSNTNVGFAVTVQCLFPDGYAGPRFAGTILEEQAHLIDLLIVEIFGSGATCHYLRPESFWRSMERWLSWSTIPVMISITPAPYYGLPGDYIDKRTICSDQVVEKIIGKGASGIVIADASYDVLQEDQESYSLAIAKMMMRGQRKEIIIPPKSVISDKKVSPLALQFNCGNRSSNTAFGQTFLLLIWLVL